MEIRFRAAARIDLERQIDWIDQRDPSAAETLYWEGLAS
jgi:plasmid stabilization system protein ParE